MTYELKLLLQTQILARSSNEYFFQSFINSNLWSFNNMVAKRFL